MLIFITFNLIRNSNCDICPFTYWVSPYHILHNIPLTHPFGSRAGIESQTFCNMLNTSSCGVTERSGNFVTYVYNPLSRRVSPWVRVPVTGQAYTVTDPEGRLDRGGTRQGRVLYGV